VALTLKTLLILLGICLVKMLLLLL